MASNSLTPEQDLATRDFFELITRDENYLSAWPASRRSIISDLLLALNYNWLPNGAFVDKAIVVKMPFGSTDYRGYPNEWDDDKERSIEKINSEGTPEASASKPSESPEVREAVLPEDV